MPNCAHAIKPVKMVGLPGKIVIAWSRAVGLYSTSAVRSLKPLGNAGEWM